MLLETYIIGHNLPNWIISPVPIKFVLEDSNNIFNNPLLAAVIGAIFGFLSAYVNQKMNDNKQLKERKRKVKIIVKNLYTEIAANISETAQSLVPDTQNVKDEFDKITKGLKPNSYPSIKSIGVLINDYFKLYLTDLGELEFELRNRIFWLYKIIEKRSAIARKLETLFSEYYNKNPLVTKEELKRLLDQLLDDDRMIRIVGSEALAYILKYFPDTHINENIKMVEMARIIITDYVEKLKIDEDFSVDDIKNITGVDYLSSAMTLIKLSNVKNINYGTYKKLK